jgi:D-proline reductase (dithiol) PrdB
MLTISRRCVPFTPFDKDLAKAVVTLVSATGVYAAGQEPFPTEDPGDITYRVIAGDADVGALRIAHHHYDHSEADADPNDKHYAYGFTTRLRELYETTFPEIADKVERSKTKLVVMTAGCPETCHRTIATLAREIEARGVPTIVITASPAATASVHPPRAMTFDGSDIGRVVGRAGDRDFHRAAVRAALEMFTHDTPPGMFVTMTVR